MIPSVVYRLLATLIALSPCITSAMAQQQCRICGKVLDEHGRAVPDALLHFNHGPQTLTDSAGSYCVGPIQAGEWRVEVKRAGFETVTRTVQLPPSSTRLDWALHPVERLLEGVIINADPFREQLESLPLASVKVDSAWLRQYLAPNLMFSLGRLPGVRAASMGTGIAKPVIRGLSRSRLVVIDRGVKQEGQQWGADHGLEIDPFYAERIEILRGPAALTYGSDAIGGALRVEPAAPPVGPEARLLASYQHNIHNVATSAAVAWRENKWFGRVRLSRQSYGDLSVPADSFRYNRYVLPLLENRLKNTAGRDWSLTTEAGRLHRRGFADLAFALYRQEVGIFTGAFGVPRISQLADDGESRNVGQPAQHVRHYKLLHRNRVQYNDWRLEIDAGLQHNDRRELARPHAHGFGPSIDTDESLTLRLTTASLNLRARHLWNPLMKGTAGLNMESQFNRIGGYEFFLAEYDRWSAGLFYLLEYRASARLDLQAGARLDGQTLRTQGHAQMTYAANGQEQGVETLAAPLRRRWAVPTWSLGLNWRVADSLLLKAHVGSSFRFPQAVELTANGVHHGGFRHELGSAALGPERGFQADFGGEWRWGWGRISLSPYLLYFTNYLYLSPSYRFSRRPEGGQLYAYEQTEARFWGGEALAEFNAMQWFFLEVGGDYTRADNFLTDLPMPFTPPPQAWAELKFKRTYGGKSLRDWYVSAECRMTDAQRRVDRNELETPGSVLWHMRAGAAWNAGKAARIHVYGQMLNLLDAKYFNHLSNYRFLNLPEPSRNFILTFAVDWSGQDRSAFVRTKTPSSTR